MYTIEVTENGMELKVALLFVLTVSKVKMQSCATDPVASIVTLKLTSTTRCNVATNKVVVVCCLSFELCVTPEC